MENAVILYEYPFNEKVRTYLRLEHLFTRLKTLMAREYALDHHYALTTIFEVMDVGARADLKTDVLKDIEKQKQLFNSYRGNPSIAEQALDDVLGDLDQCFIDLNSSTGKAGHALTENDWLMGVRSRMGIPGGTCEFDLPAYYAWQHELPSKRQADLQIWGGTLAPLENGIRLLLSILRQSGSPQKMVAHAGQFQQNLPSTKTYQLLRMRIQSSLGLIPEISGNRLIVLIRLMQQDETMRLISSVQDAAFELTLCS